MPEFRRREPALLTRGSASVASRLGDDDVNGSVGLAASPAVIGGAPAPAASVGQTRDHTSSIHP
jgi:hypothetical protein